MAAVRHKYKKVADLPGSGTLGDVYYITSTEHYYAWDGSQWVDLGIFSSQQEAFIAASQYQQAATDAAQATEVAVPSTASSTGKKGTISYDDTHLYVCVETNTWVRCTLATW